LEVLSMLRGIHSIGPWSRLVALLILSLGLFGPVALVAPVRPIGLGQAAALADDDENRGHGNDEDRDGEDNPGRGHKDKDKDKDKEERVVAVPRYGVEVGCGFDQAAGRTSCTFAARAEDDVAPIADLAIPAEAVCTTIIGGDYEADFDRRAPGDDPIAYSARAGKAELVLLFAGEVSVAGLTTYWIATDAGLFPADGPALGCQAQETPTTPTTGAIEILALDCGAPSPADPAAFDWYGQCQAPLTAVAFALGKLEADDVIPAGDGATDEAGQLLFAGLAPGTCNVTEPDGVWCHAESNSVNERGEVVVEAGAVASVWIFHCAGDAAGEQVK
jgi:hypothetical protein